VSKQLPAGLQRLIDWVTRTPERADPVLRRKSRLLAACVACMIPVFILVDSALLLTVPGHEPPLVGYLFMLTVFVLNRRGAYRPASILIAAMIPIVVFYLVVRDAPVVPALTLSYLPLGILLGTIFLPLRGVLAITGLEVAGLFALPYVAPGVTPDRILVEPLSGTALCGAAAMLYMVHRNQLERDRRQEQESLEAQLRQAQKMEVVGQLAGGIAHDFNNMLTVIAGNSSLLRRKAPASELDEIDRAVESASRLTRQLLAFGRRAMLSPRPTHLGAVIDSAVSMLRRIIGDDVRVEVDVEAGLWPVRVDEAQVREILLNLATNARDAMPDGGELRIEARNATDRGVTTQEGLRLDGRFVELSVTDTGAGMNDEALAHAFEPFFTTKGVGKGSGLGLAMVYGGMNQNGGHVELASQPGRGTRVRLLFPRCEEVPAEPAPKRSTGPERGAGTVLLVEDEAAVRELCERLLRQHGYHVLAAPDAAAARALFDARPEAIDILLTDVVMPGGSGFELAETLRARRPHLPVLFISGQPDRAPGRDDLQGDGHELLAKPFSEEQLLGALGRLLERAQAEGVVIPMDARA
jgi:signal transduction histidine kinase/ActR/RegA family two-component response regulator